MLLTGGLCSWHFRNGGEMPKGSDTDTVTAVKLEPAIHNATAKQAALNRTYYKLRIIFLNANLYCLARLEGCTIRSTDVHHPEGRLGKRLTDTTKFLPVCRSCHDYLHNNDEEAIRLGFSLKRHTI